jgi:SAM-dependent methyltransferase
VTAYVAAGEFYELVAERQVRHSGPPLRTALAGVDAAAGPILEVGAGTGRVTEVIAAAVPTADVMACEPAATMRAVLTSRVAGDETLRARVDIGAAAAPHLPPGPFCAAVLFGVVGHLEPAERADLWTRLARELPRGAPVVVELMGVGAPRTIPPVRMLREQLGDQTYEWWTAGEPDGPGRMRFDTTWRVLDAHGACLREVAESYPWYTLSPRDLARESGFTVDRVDGEIVTLRVG